MQDSNTGKPAQNKTPYPGYKLWLEKDGANAGSEGFAEKILQVSAGNRQFCMEYLQ